jgi:hypothetical protein
MRNKLCKFLPALMLALAAILMDSCSYAHMPPDPGTPEPTPHSGMFVSGNDTLWFNGDGRSVRWSFSEPVSKIGRTGSGEYVFLFRNKRWRYDVAESFRLIDTGHGNASYTFPVLQPASETLIPIRFDDLQYYFRQIVQE